MTRRFFNLIYAATAGLGIATASGATAQDITLKVADSFPPGHNIANHGTKWWMERVTELTDGKVAFEYYGAEQLGKLSDMLTLVQRGVADIGYVPPTFNAGRMPLSTVHNLPNLFSSSKVGSLAFYDTIFETDILGQDYTRNLIRPMWGVMTSTYNVFTKDSQIKTLAELEGLKLKTAGGYQSDAVRLLGGVPINIPSPETYQAFQLGTVDGAIFPTSAAASYKLPEIAKHYTTGFNVSVFYASYAINLEVWEGLPQDVRDAFEQANREVNVRMGKFFDDDNQRLLDSYVEQGVEIYDLPEEEREKVKTALQPMYQSWLDDMKERGFNGEAVLSTFREKVEKERAAQ